MLAPTIAWPTVFMPYDYALLAQFAGFTAMYFADSKAATLGWGSLIPNVLIDVQPTNRSFETSPTMVPNLPIPANLCRWSFYCVDPRRSWTSKLRYF